MKTTTKRISSLLASALMLFGALGSVACDDKDKPEPVYKNPEGLLLTTREAAEGQAYGTVNIGSFFIFYSDNFPIISLYNSNLTIHSLTDKQIFLFATQAGNPPVTTLPLILFYYVKPYINQLNLPGCDKSKLDAILEFDYYVPEDGQYDFFFRIENPEKGIYYQTPNYRYTKTTKDGLYTTSISIIN